MRKKKKGSSLVVLLAIAMVITIIGSALVGAITYTQSGNQNEKVNEDIVYAAESGIEQAVANVDNGMYDSVAAGSPTLPIILDTEFIKNGITVKVELNKNIDGFRYMATSTAKKGSKVKVVKATIKRKFTQTGTPGPNLLEFSLCSKELNIYYNAEFNTSFTLVNSVASPNTKYVGVGTPPRVPTMEGLKDMSFPDIQPKIPRYDGNIVVSSVDGVGNSLEKLANQTESNPASNNGVKRIEYKVTKGDSRGTTIYVYIVNSPNLIISNSTLQFTNTVILCAGNLTICGNKNALGTEMNADGTFNGTIAPSGSTSGINLNNSTFVANKINLYANSVTLNSPTYKLGSGSNVLNDGDELDIVNGIIGDNCDWGPTTGTPGPIIWDSTDVSYHNDLAEPTP